MTMLVSAGLALVVSVAANWLGKHRDRRAACVEAAARLFHALSPMVRASQIYDGPDHSKAAPLWKGAYDDVQAAANDLHLALAVTSEKYRAERLPIVAAVRARIMPILGHPESHANSSYAPFVWEQVRYPGAIQNDIKRLFPELAVAGVLPPTVLEVDGQLSEDAQKMIASHFGQRQRAIAGKKTEDG